MTYSKFLPRIAPDIEVCPLELPGRGKKYDQQLEKTIDGMVDRLLYDEILPKVDNGTRYNFWGHSMGGILAYELLRRMDSLPTANLPYSVIISGCPSPMTMSGREPIYNLPPEEFKQKIIQYGYSNSAILFSNSDLENYFLPILLADFEAVDTYEYRMGSRPDISLFVLSGSDDACTSPDGLKGWKDVVSDTCEFYTLKGGHFFPFEKAEEFTGIVRDILSRTKDD